MYSAMLIIYLGILGFLLLKSSKEKLEVNILPSLCWATFMVMPFFIQKHYFSDFYLPIQVFGIFVIAVSLLLGDFYVLFRKGGPKKLPVTRKLPHEPLITVLVWLGILSIQLFHLYSMPQIPLIAKIFKSAGELELVTLREQSSKFLKIPPILIYMAQTSILASPVIIVSFMKQQRVLAALGVFTFTIFYSFATLAKGPIVMFSAIFMVMAYEFMPHRFRIVCRRVIASLLLCALTLSLVEMSSGNVESARQGEKLAAPKYGLGELTFTWGDHSRVFGEFPPGLIMWPLRNERHSSSFIYRVFIVPSEVSHRWYTFFPDVYGRFIGFYGLTPSTRNSTEYQSPSNIVGIWAYRSRFPFLYGSSVHAYSSVDADAYARWGVIGLIAIGLILFIIRVLLSVAWSESWLAQSIIITTLTIIALTLPNASLQAILVAHGVAVFVGLLLVIKLMSRAID